MILISIEYKGVHFPILTMLGKWAENQTNSEKMAPKCFHFGGIYFTQKIARTQNYEYAVQCSNVNESQK